MWVYGWMGEGKNCLKDCLQQSIIKVTKLSKVEHLRWKVDLKNSATKKVCWVDGREQKPV